MFGTGAGAVVTCSLADLVLVRQPFGTSAYVQGPSVRPEARIVDFGFVAGFALLVAGIACLLLDLGRIDRALSLFLNPQPTLLTVGSFALAALAVLATVMLVQANGGDVRMYAFLGCAVGWALFKLGPARILHAAARKMLCLWNKFRLHVRDISLFRHILK